MPTRPQNSSSVCQSRPLRASREASIETTAPTPRPSQMAARSLSKPGRAMPRRRSGRVVVDHLDGVPPQRAGAIDQGVLPAATLVNVEDLIGRRLA